MKGIVYIDQSLAEFIPNFIKDRKKDIADIKGLLERDVFDGIIEILKTIRETANTFGFKDLTAMSSHALTVAKKKDDKGTVDLIRKMEQHLEKIKIVYVEYGEESEMNFYGNDADDF
jgi:DNA-binding ferritin-like protein